MSRKYVTLTYFAEYYPLSHLYLDVFYVIKSNGFKLGPYFTVPSMKAISHSPSSKERQLVSPSPTGFFFYQIHVLLHIFPKYLYIFGSSFCSFNL